MSFKEFPENPNTSHYIQCKKSHNLSALSDRINPDMSSHNLPHILAELQLLQQCSLRDWDRLLPWARRVGVVGKFYTYLEEQGQLDRIPAQVQPHLEAASIIAAEHERRIRWECNRIQRALFDLQDRDFPVILLKGAAYAMASLPCAHGRLVSDVDIMVPKSSLATLEPILQKHGWETVKNSDYDQQYYRQWMHELPPLRHRLRGTILDVHHTILPETSRLKPDPALLIAASRPLPNTPFRIFCPADMVLHSAAHAFQEELGNPLRDLLDLHELLTHFSEQEPDFWETLPAARPATRPDPPPVLRPALHPALFAHRSAGNRHSGAEKSQPTLAPSPMHGSTPRRHHPGRTSPPHRSRCRPLAALSALTLAADAASAAGSSSRL